MKNVTHRNYGYGNPNFQQKPEADDFEIIVTIGGKQYEFQNEEFLNDSPNRHPEQDRNLEYPLAYDYDDEEIDPDDNDDEDEDEDDQDENEEDDLHPRRNLFDQDLLNPFTTDAGL